MLRAALHEGRDHLHAMGATHHGLDRVDRCMDTAGHAERRVDVPRYDRQPAEPQRQFGRRGQTEVRDDFQVLDIDIGLIEAVEQNQPIRTDFVEFLGNIGKRRTKFNYNRKQSEVVFIEFGTIITVRRLSFI